NDVYGHAVGDVVLREVAGRIRSAVRKEDIPGRWGGEEFLVLLPFLAEEGVWALGERLRAIVADGPVGLRDGRAVAVSVSLGGAASGAEDTEALLRRADEALYAAKRGGRNTVRVAGLPSA